MSKRTKPKMARSWWRSWVRSYHAGIPHAVCDHGCRWWRAVR